MDDEGVKEAAKFAVDHEYNKAAYGGYKSYVIKSAEQQVWNCFDLCPISLVRSFGWYHHWIDGYVWLINSIKLSFINGY